MTVSEPRISLASKRANFDPSRTYRV